jgi:hypothetical protein
MVKYWIPRILFQSALVYCMQARLLFGIFQEIIPAGVYRLRPMAPSPCLRSVVPFCWEPVGDRSAGIVWILHMKQGTGHLIVEELVSEARHKNISEAKKCQYK